MQLKELISKNLPDLEFVKSTQKNKAEQLIASSTQAITLNAHTELLTDESDICPSWKLAKKIYNKFQNKIENCKENLLAEK